MVVSDPKESIACIGFGSNLGNSLQLVQESWKHLGQYDGIWLQILSAPYRTEPMEMESDHWFINAVGIVKTLLSPDDLLDQLLQIEHYFGRRRDRNVSWYQDRTLDLDLLLYDDLILETSRLIIPHPKMHTRPFVLVPLADLLPNFVHPQLQCTMEALRKACCRKQIKSGLDRVCWPTILKE